VTITGISRDELIDSVAKEIFSKIPPLYDMVKVKKNFAIDVTPTTIVLFQELERFNILIKRMTRTLNQLRKVTVNLQSSMLVQSLVFFNETIFRTIYFLNASDTDS